MNQPSPKGLCVLLLALLAPSPARGATFLAHHDPQSYFAEVGSVLVLHQDWDGALGECTELPAGKAQKSCVLRKRPALKPLLRSKFSLLCPDKAPFPVSIKALSAHHWGHAHYAVGTITQPLRKHGICAARVGPKAWGKARLRSPGKRPFKRPDSALIAARVKTQLRSILSERCSEYGDVGGARTCSALVTKALQGTTIGLYEAKLPGTRVGLAVAMVSSPDGKDAFSYEGAPVEIVATIDSSGGFVEVLATGMFSCGGARC